MGFYGARTYAFFWKTPDERACVKVANFPIPAMTYEYLDFAYELRTPNPLGMSSGLYTGSLSYRLGPGGDFDFGDVMIPNDPDLTLDFVLDVQHTLKVEIPPGGDKVKLVPAGGWQSWLHAGRRPRKSGHCSRPTRPTRYVTNSSTKRRPAVTASTTPMSVATATPSVFGC
jgi:hypothetical protein